MVKHFIETCKNLSIILDEELEFLHQWIQGLAGYGLGFTRREDDTVGREIIAEQGETNAVLYCYLRKLYARLHKFEGIRVTSV